MASKGDSQQESPKLVKLRVLGTGAYGAVHVVLFGDTVCAAKIMHQVLFHFSSTGQPTMLERFEQEIELLRSIRHPCIIQFLDKVMDDESGLPVLLMELMDENLTSFLDKLEHPPQYHVQVNICHDIASALSYIHSRRYIHRDVSSNNVLLVAGSGRAKLSDFGVSRLTAGRLDTMTTCPGSQAYMAPECVINEPVYTGKVDIFSLGVVGIQTATCQFPNPQEAFKAFPMPSGIMSPSRPLMCRVLEVERRQNHIRLIPDHHQLKSSFLSCLADDPDRRPTAHELCELLVKYKERSEYKESLEGSQSNQRLEEQLDHRVRELTEARDTLQRDLQVVRRQAQANFEEAEQQKSLAASLQRDLERSKRPQVQQESSSRSFLGLFGRSNRENEQRLRVAEQERTEALEQRDNAITERDEVLEATRLEVISVRDELEWVEARLTQKQQHYTRAIRKYDELQVDYNQQCHLLRQAQRREEEAEHRVQAAQRRVQERSTKLDEINDSLDRAHDEIELLRNQLEDRDQMIEDITQELEAEQQATSQHQSAADQQSLQSIMEYIRKTSDERIDSLKRQLADRDKELEACQEKIANLEGALAACQPELPLERSSKVDRICSCCFKATVRVSLQVRGCHHTLCKLCVIELVKETELDALKCPVSMDSGLCSNSVPKAEIYTVLDPEEVQDYTCSHPKEKQKSFIENKTNREGEEITDSSSTDSTGSTVVPKPQPPSDRYDLCPLESLPSCLQDTNRLTESEQPNDDDYLPSEVMSTKSEKNCKLEYTVKLSPVPSQSKGRGRGRGRGVSAEASKARGPTVGHKNAVDKQAGMVNPEPVEHISEQKPQSTSPAYSHKADTSSSTSPLTNDSQQPLKDYRSTAGAYGRSVSLQEGTRHEQLDQRVINSYPMTGTPAPSHNPNLPHDQSRRLYPPEDRHPPPHDPLRYPTQQNRPPPHDPYSRDHHPVPDHHTHQTDYHDQDVRRPTSLHEHGRHPYNPSHPHDHADYAHPPPHGHPPHEPHGYHEPGYYNRHYSPQRMNSWSHKPRTEPIRYLHHDLYPPSYHPGLPHTPEYEPYAEPFEIQYRSLGQASYSSHAGTHRSYTSPHPLQHDPYYDHRRPHPHLHSHAHTDGSTYSPAGSMPYSSLRSQHTTQYPTHGYHEPPPAASFSPQMPRSPFPSYQTDTESLFSSLRSSDRQPDEFLAVLMQQRHIENKDHSWKVVFTVCLREPCLVQPLQELLTESFGEHFEVASFCIKFREAVILKIPMEDMRQKGYRVSTVVSPCKIARSEVYPSGPLELRSKATATYPPRRTLTISPMLGFKIKRKELDNVSLTLEGVETCEHQREFNLKSPSLTPTSPPRAAEPLPPHHNHQPFKSKLPAAASAPGPSFSEMLQRECDTNSVVTVLGSYLKEKTLEFGQALNVPYDRIKELCRQATSQGFPNSHYRWLCDTVEHWRTHTEEGPTWQAIVIALKKMNEMQLVRLVEDHLRNHRSRASSDAK